MKLSCVIIWEIMIFVVIFTFLFVFGLNVKGIEFLPQNQIFQSLYLSNLKF